MRTWPAKVGDLFRQWRIVRADIREKKILQRDQSAADELERAREGLNRFPRPGSDPGILAGCSSPPTRRATLAPVIVVNRFRVAEPDQEAFRHDLERAHETLAVQRGYVRGRIGRNVDDPLLWLLTTEWEGPGAYRRALSAYDVKLTAVPVLSRAVDEPSAYETVEPDTELNRVEPRSLG